MFLGQHARRQGGSVISYKHGHDGLREDLAVIELGRHPVHRCSRKSATRFNGALVCVEPSERGQQRGMDVDQAAGIVRHETRSENAHEAGKHDQRRLVAVYGLLQGSVERIARGKIFMVQHFGLNAQ